MNNFRPFVRRNSKLPEARGKGFATQTVQTALEDAQELGYRVAILQASAMGPVYQRMGFQECFPIKIYPWQPLSTFNF
ncbi:GNAT family N-acetyltransferase [Leptolyngbya sp. FACHB-541]|uniref:GNAT family N-acetyltransferase n=1 Tax=Leptolyngbya sp. FACHB-541 TaxID=2692810 RepID=UPI0032204229